MKKIKEKIKGWLLTDEDFGEDESFATKKEFLYFIGMCSGWMIIVVLGLFTWAFMVMSGDLVSRIEDQERQIDNLTYESARYKMMYEDLYNTYIYPQEQNYEEGNNNE